MATERLVHKHRIDETHIRELDVCYDKGGINYFDYSTKPKGIYFASTVYEQPVGSIWKTLKVGIGQKRPGVGYILVVPLTNYRPKALREVRARVEQHAMAIHTLCAVGDTASMEQLRAILTGEVVPAPAPAVAEAEA